MRCTARQEREAPRFTINEQNTGWHWVCKIVLSKLYRDLEAYVIQYRSGPIETECGRAHSHVTSIAPLPKQPGYVYNDHLDMWNSFLHVVVSRPWRGRWNSCSIQCMHSSTLVTLNDPRYTRCHAHELSPTRIFKITCDVIPLATKQPKKYCARNMYC